MQSGMIFNIQRFSIYDGPGARTTVFFKGCNLKCKWCHNPESISAQRLLEFYPDKCIGCSRCFKACPESAHVLTPEGRHEINRALCKRCMICADSCFAEALIPVGETVTDEKVIHACLTDLEYYKGSQGGVTCSGGECMQQIDFLAEVLQALHEHGIHTAVDTAGHQPWEKFEKILPYTDMFLYDVKAANGATHKALTGVSNELILANLKRLSDLGKCLWIRIPYIPGYNSSEMEQIAELLTNIQAERIEIMPFHRLGEGKYAALGLDNTGFECKIPSDQEIDGTVEMMRAKGLNARRS